MLTLAINGFGRIGRNALKISLGNPDIQVVAINDLTDAATLAYLLKHDTNYGAWEAEVGAKGSSLIVNGREIPVFAEKDPAQLPWKKMGIDVVLECTGLFLTEEGAGAHVKAGAKHVVLSAPAKGGDIQTYVRGVNCKDLAKDRRPIVSNASCTTNCAAPVMAVLDAAFGIEHALLTTVHGYTASQALVDAPKKDVREGRAAAENMIPTSTGAAIAVTETLPQLRDRFDGVSIRVPVPVVSLCDIVMTVRQNVTVDEVNEALQEAAKYEHLHGILQVSEEPLVSSDYVGDPHSATVDADMTYVVGGKLVKVLAWYDNEWGYSNRLVELAVLAGKRW